MNIFKGIKNYIKAIAFSIKHPGRMSSTVYAKYPQESDFQGRRVLNIGCGFAQYAAPNVVNVDAFDTCKPDVVWDLSKTPMPFKDEEFDLVIANHILEHVPDWWECFKECSRILKVGGRFEIWLPGIGNDSVLGYRDHINTINQCSFAGTFGHYRNKGNAWESLQFHGDINRMKLDGQFAHLENQWWISASPQFMRHWYAKYLRNVVFECGFHFVKQEHHDFKHAT